MAVTIRGKALELPIVQGGMGIGVSLERLAGAVAALGGMGTLSAAFCGFREPDFSTNPREANLRALIRQIGRAKEIAKGAGLVAVNVMVAAAQYADSVRAALAPVVSGGRSAALICKLWDRRYGRVPDFVVVEGPLAGGHLGFSPEEAREAQAGRPRPLSALLAEVLEALAPFREKYGRDIPVFVAGGVKSGAELRRYMDQGAAGVQFATRFIATEECDASSGYKQALLDAEAEDVTIVQSPVGMPGRALRSPLIRRVEAGTQPKITRCDRCLAACDCKTAPYCISKALIAAVEGDWENGLFFCGANAGEVNTLSTVKEQMDQILNEWRTAP